MTMLYVIYVAISFAQFQHTAKKISIVISTFQIGENLSNFVKRVDRNGLVYPQTGS
jgi:hypothetical protein